MDLNDPQWEFLKDDMIFLNDLYEDRVDPRLPWCFAGTRDRERFAGALHQLADLFTSRHDLPMPKDGYARLEVITEDGRRVAEIAHGPEGYLFKVLPGAYEEPADAKSAPKLAAADTPAAGPRVSHVQSAPSKLSGRVKRSPHQGTGGNR